MEGLRAGSDALCVLGRGSDRLVKLLEFLQRRFEVELPEELFEGECPLGGDLPGGFPPYFTQWEEGLEPEALGKLASAILGKAGKGPAAAAVARPISGAAKGGAGAAASSAASSGGPRPGGPATPAGRRLVSRVAVLLGAARQVRGSEDPAEAERRGIQWTELWRVLTAEAEPQELQAACGNTLKGFQRLLSMRQDIFERTEDSQGVRLKPGASSAKIPAVRPAVAPPAQQQTQAQAHGRSGSGASDPAAREDGSGSASATPARNGTWSKVVATEPKGARSPGSMPASAASQDAHASVGQPSPRGTPASPTSRGAAVDSPVAGSSRESRDSSSGVGGGQVPSPPPGGQGQSSPGRTAGAPPAAAPQGAVPPASPGSRDGGAAAAAAASSAPATAQLTAVEKDAVASARLAEALHAELKQVPVLGDFVQPAPGRIDIGHLHPQTVQSQAPPHVAALLNNASGGVVVFFSQASPARVVSEDQRRMLSEAAQGAIAREIKPMPPAGSLQVDWVSAADMGLNGLPGGRAQAVFVVRVNQLPEAHDVGYFVSGCLPVRHAGATRVLHQPQQLAHFYRNKLQLATAAIGRLRAELIQTREQAGLARKEADAARQETMAAQAAAAEHEKKAAQAQAQAQARSAPPAAVAGSSGMGAAHSSHGPAAVLPMSFSAGLQHTQHGGSSGSNQSGPGMQAMGAAGSPPRSSSDPSPQGGSAGMVHPQGAGPHGGGALLGDTFSGLLGGMGGQGATAPLSASGSSAPGSGLQGAGGQQVGAGGLLDGALLGPGVAGGAGIGGTGGLGGGFGEAGGFGVAGSGNDQSGQGLGGFQSIFS